MPDTFTPEQISQILEAFFRVVGTRQYIGSRYVPLFGRKDEESIEWDNTGEYEPLTIVLYQGNSYTSRQFVPVGVEITNQEFWAITGNYNAQIEQYRRDTLAAVETAENALGVANGAQGDINTLLPKADFDAENTVKKYVDDSVAAVQNDIDTLLPKADFDSENTVKKYVDDSVDTLSDRIDALQTTATDEVYVTITEVNTFAIDAEIYYAQGCTCDAYGNYYIVADTRASSGHGLIYKFDSNLELVGSPTPINTHANALEYDPVNNRVVFYISNTQLGIVDCETMEVVKRTTSVASPKFNYSGIGISNDYAVMNITGTYDYILFQRYGNTLNAVGSVSTPSAGAINFRQDGCMHDNVFYQLYSNGNVASRIRSLSVGGTHGSDFIITNVRKEFEGIFYREDAFYVVDADFTMYRVNDQLRYTGIVSKLFLNPAVELFRRKSINTDDDTSKFVTVTISSSTYQIGVLQFMDRINAYANTCRPLNINALGNGRVMCAMATTGAFTYRGVTRTGKIIEISYYAASNYPSSVRLANIRYRVGDQEYNIYPTEAQLTNLEQLQTQLQSFFEDANTRGLELGHIGIYGYGTINTNTTTLTSYDLGVE